MHLHTYTLYVSDDTSLTLSLARLRAQIWIQFNRTSQWRQRAIGRFTFENEVNVVMMSGTSLSRSHSLFLSLSQLHSPLPL